MEVTMKGKFAKAGKRIKFVREYRNISEEQLADKLGIELDTLLQIEKDGSGIYGGLLLDIGRELEVDHNYIFEGLLYKISDGSLREAAIEYEEKIK